MRAKLASLGRLTLVMESGGFMADFQQCSITMLQSQWRVRGIWSLSSLLNCSIIQAGCHHLSWSKSPDCSRGCVAGIYCTCAQLFFHLPSNFRTCFAVLISETPAGTPQSLHKSNYWQIQLKVCFTYLHIIPKNYQCIYFSDSTKEY